MKLHTLAAACAAVATLSAAPAFAAEPVIAKLAATRRPAGEVHRRRRDVQLRRRRLRRPRAATSQTFATDTCKPIAAKVGPIAAFTAAKAMDDARLGACNAAAVARGRRRAARQAVGLRLRSPSSSVVELLNLGRRPSGRRPFLCASRSRTLGREDPVTNRRVARRPALCCGAGDRVLSGARLWARGLRGLSADVLFPSAFKPLRLQRRSSAGGSLDAPGGHLSGGRFQGYRMWARATRRPCSIWRPRRRQVAAVEADLKSLKAALRRQPRPARPGRLAGVQRRGQGQGPGRHRRQGASSTRPPASSWACWPPTAAPRALPAVITGFEALAAKARGAVSAEVTTAVAADRRPGQGRRRRAAPGAGQGPRNRDPRRPRHPRRASRCGSAPACSTLR